MRSSALAILVVTSLGFASCATSNADKVCSAVPSWEAPAYRCVGAAPAAEPAPVPPPVVAPRRAEIKGERIELKETVDFKTNSAELLHSSDALLDEVVKIMKDHPEIKRIRIEGHADSTGVREHNQKLSEARAASVRVYLSNHGIEPGRLISKGFGSSRPIADNATDAGRAQNRRVEVHIEERK